MDVRNPHPLHYFSTLFIESVSLNQTQSPTIWLVFALWTLPLPSEARLIDTVASRHLQYVVRFWEFQLWLLCLCGMCLTTESAPQPLSSLSLQDVRWATACARICLDGWVLELLYKGLPARHVRKHHQGSPDPHRTGDLALLLQGSCVAEGVPTYLPFFQVHTFHIAGVAPTPCPFPPQWQ